LNEEDLPRRAAAIIADGKILGSFQAAPNGVRARLAIAASLPTRAVRK